MALRCLLFSSDEETAAPIRQVLAGLGVEGKYCTDAISATEEVTCQNYQIVIIDWDKQPEAGLLLNTARDRKAAERPLTLAVVSDDQSVPQALQAGANSVLRKPLLINQVTDTLTTARDLLRAKQESATAAAAGASASSSSNEFKSSQAEEAPVHGTGILESTKAQFGSTSHAPEFVSAFDVVNSAATSAPKVPEAPVIPAPPPPQEEARSETGVPEEADNPRGLQWYLKRTAGSSPAAAAPAKAPAKSGNPELLGFDQMPAAAPAAAQKPREVFREQAPEPAPEPVPNPIHEQKKEAELFAYMDGEKPVSREPSPPGSGLGKRAIIGALVLAALAIVAAPQAPWHASMRQFFINERKTMHAWLNPQPVTPVQAPISHENFERAGDEYKLPTAEPIPDATTDPSQIQVVPVTDPTAKKPADPNALTQPPPLPAGTTLATPATTPTPETTGSPDSTTTPAAGPREPFAAPVSTPKPTVFPTTVTPSNPQPRPAIPQSLSTPLAPDSPVASAPPPSTTQPKTPPHYATPPGNVPSSLKSQMASTTPEMSGNKAPEAALPTIEPVSVTESAERALALEQPAPVYPASVKNQQGMVVLQVLVGRDGAVQDAKFVQGSFAFARAAIDAAKSWKFKPYIMNGRPVSVQTQLTMSFKPGQ